MLDVLQKDRDTLTQSMNQSYLGWYFPRELNRLVVDYAALTVVYDILLERDDKNWNDSECEVRVMVSPSVLQSAWYVVSLWCCRFVDDSLENANRLIDEKYWRLVRSWEHENRPVSILGYLDPSGPEDPAGALRFLVNGNSIRGLPISVTDGFPCLEILSTRCDPTEGYMQLVSPFSRTRVFLKSMF